jgi:hypothetical protein
VEWTWRAHGLGGALESLEACGGKALESLEACGGKAFGTGFYYITMHQLFFFEYKILTTNRIELSTRFTSII